MKIHNLACSPGRPHRRRPDNDFKRVFARCRMSRTRTLSLLQRQPNRAKEKRAMARILTSRQFQAVYQVGERLATVVCASAESFQRSNPRQAGAVLLFIRALSSLNWYGNRLRS